MFALYCFLAVLIIPIKSWDIALTVGDQLELYTNGTKTDISDVRLTELKALAYDAVHNILLFVDANNDNASIFSYHLEKKKFQPLVRRKVSDNIQGVAFDPVTGLLFWADSNQRSIMYKSVIDGSKNEAYGNLLLKTDREIPRAIVVDSCRGYIYWSNTNTQNATIERMRLDGTDRKVIVQDDLFMPTSIAIDQREKRLYWADDRQGIHYSIESSDLDGKFKRTVYKGVNHMPNYLTVSKDHIYWTDWGYKSVWKYPKAGHPLEQLEKVTSYADSNPFGIVANYNIEDQITDVNECRDLVNLSKNKTAINDSFKELTQNEGLFCLHGVKTEGKLTCKCSPGYSGERCEVSVCQNFCFHGDCRISGEGQPTCNCALGYKGQRCEIEMCRGHCLNNGVCNLINKVPQCTCTKDYEGNRCEVEKHIKKIEDIEIKTLEEAHVKDSCNCTEEFIKLANAVPKLSIHEQTEGGVENFESCAGDWDAIRDPIIMVLGTLCGLLCLVCAVLVTKVLQLKKRPRIKKRIIMHKSGTPLTARPDQCEITIENCCNMNICETKKQGSAMSVTYKACMKKIVNMKKARELRQACKKSIPMSPCFEPRTIRPNLLDSKPGKEEKKTLIANMEQQDDLY